MGREIRRVIANWEHPKRDRGGYQPMFDRVASERFIEWLKEFEDFKRDDLEKSAKEYGYDINDPYSAYCDWNGEPPDPHYYRPSWDESEATWWQVYETVSEGTPVTPPFETQDELIDYLVENGDYWDQMRRNEKRGHFMSTSSDPWSREMAEKFVKGPGWAPSAVIVDGVVKSGVEALSLTLNQ